MLKYFESEKYKRDKHVIHFVLIGVCVVIIIAGLLIYFN